MPTPSLFPIEVLSSLAQAGQSFIQQFAQAASSAARETQQPTTSPANPTAAFAESSTRFAELQQRYLQEMTSLWSGTMGPSQVAAAGPSGQGAPQDRRFADEAWHNDPYFDFLRRSYLMNASYAMEMVESASVDERTRERLRFAARQYLDALSPTNYIATNPEAIKLAIETKGQSLTEGVKLLMQDLEKGRISMTDESAFEVGRNLAVSPGAVVFENDLIQVIQYQPLTDKVYQRPLLMVPPCINKFYILDLQPGNSLVRYAVEQGHTVFMVSWRSITPELGHLTWDDYIERGVAQAIDVALQVSGADKINTLGFCVGGTLLGSTLAVQAARHEDKVACVTLLTTMLDFIETGDIGLFVDEQSVAARDSAMGKGGVMPGKELAFTFSSLRANDLVWNYVVGSYLKGKGPPAFDLLYWNSDSADMSGPMYCWYLRNTYLENRLRVPGGTTQCGVAVDLSKITAPAYVLATREDHIVPWVSAYATTRLLPGETVFVLGASGHIAGIVNPASKNKRNYWHGGKLGGSADDWLNSAESAPGSWWTHWSQWLAPHGGAMIAARDRLGGDKYKEIEPAPGRYVRAKAQ